MRPSDRRKVRKVGQRLGRLKPALVAALPNLPNLPNLFLTRVRARVPAYAHRYGHARARSHALIPSFQLGRLGRLGSGTPGAGFSLPNLLPTFRTLGTTMAFDIDEFRRNYPDAMAALRKFEGWKDADLDECDAAVAAAYERADQHELQCWAKWVWLLALRMRRWRREKAEADEVKVIPLMTPTELERLLARKDSRV